eukprot:CAMPEP_0206418334 /NCGR_PEP_ID=MMETSP0294-20121207/37959_1 /ASSEMBLY_ACC=CAM_ASM_000327 /TAXON_ID=39354 /ORGANISM="Heterosigma akashiwo, Strain CCMP2393" /LENGTH=66 /DNA_ID=CAMNT_0053881517 /DNA_START=526 /DNA_END=726 /DNA_ORIENTATION=-
MTFPVRGASAGVWGSAVCTIPAGLGADRCGAVGVRPAAGAAAGVWERAGAAVCAGLYAKWFVTVRP